MARRKNCPDIQLHDTHCHIMYGVDDGAKDREQSLRMLEMSYEEGIHNIVFTPHCHWAYDEEQIEIVEKRLRKLKAYMEQKHPDMNLYMGNEILFYNGAEKDLQTGKVFTMAGSRYVLLEFMPGDPCSYVKGAVSAMFRNDYIPIRAHIERFL